VHRLVAIVDFVNRLGTGTPVIENGDCISREDGLKIRERTGAHSVMIATAAERNLSCFAGGPLVDAETVLVPTYFSLAKYLRNPWGNSKHCLSQFTSPSPANGRARLKAFKDKLGKAKDYDALGQELDNALDGKSIMDEIGFELKRRTAETQLLEPIERKNSSSHIVTPQLASMLMTLPRSSPPTAVTTAT